MAAHEPAFVARDAVRDAVDLDKQVLVLQRGHRAERAPAVGEAALMLGDPLDVGLDARAVDLDEIARRADLADLEAIARATVQQVDGAADIRLRVGAAAPSERVEARPLGGGGGVAERDRRLDQRGVGVAHRLHLVGALQAVQPAGVDLAAAQLGAAEQLEQEALVGRALVDHDHRVGDRAAQARDRLVAVAAVGDDLGDHRVEFGRHGVALGDAGVDAHAGPGREAQQRDPPGSRREPSGGVLGVEAYLDGVAGRRRRVALEPPAGRDVELEPHEVGAGDHLGDRVLDLQARVDLHEREALPLGLVEELDGAGAAVVRVARQTHGRLGELALLLARQGRAGGLLDHLLVAALVAAVAHAQRPHPALTVGHQLDLDVARVLDHALDQDARVAERLCGLGAGALERVGEVSGVLHPAHAAPAAARSGLDHQREPDLLALPDGVLRALDRAAAPCGDRHARLLGQALGLDLVAQRAHHLGVGPDEDDPEALTQLGERRMLGDEAPAHPGRVGLRLDQRSLEQLVIEVGAAAAVAVLDHGGAEAVPLVGLADEQRVAFGVGVERDHLDRLVALVVELADGVDRAHRRLAAVDDGDAPEWTLQSGSPSLGQLTSP
jgi:hypothetical protein